MHAMQENAENTHLFLAVKGDATQADQAGLPTGTAHYHFRLEITAGGGYYWDRRRQSNSEEGTMADTKIPSKHYQMLSEKFPEVLSAVENLGATVRDAGPIDRKTSELIQLAVAAAAQSTGSVHSHTRRALEAGATDEEIYHTLLLLVSTIGFPKVAAALSWVTKIIENR